MTVPSALAFLPTRTVKHSASPVSKAAGAAALAAPAGAPADAANRIPAARTAARTREGLIAFFMPLIYPSGGPRSSRNQKRRTGKAGVAA